MKQDNNSREFDALALGYAKLKFNLNCPSLEDCYLDGYEAAKNQLAEEDNPFEYGSTEYSSWADGWWDSFYDKAPVYTYADTSTPVSLLKPLTIPHADGRIAAEIIAQPAANQSVWMSENAKTWLKRGLQIATVLLIAAAAYELSDIAA